MLRISSVLIFYFFLIFLILFTLGSCSTDRKMITTDEQLLKTTSKFCEKEKKDKIGKVIYGCASGTSSDFQLSIDKSIMLSKIKLASKIITNIDSSANYDVAEDNTGVTKTYKSLSSNITNFELTSFEILDQKTLKFRDKWITFSLLRLKM